MRKMDPKVTSAKDKDQIRASLDELTKSYADMLKSVQGSSSEMKGAIKLWRSKNKSKLIALGIKLIVFPEPTPVSELVGSCCVAAGVLQNGIKKHSIYLDDIPQILQKTLKEIQGIKHNLRV